eukprot:Tamp_23561.p1 GENE.Tamp_23561~~Tamp_23561.p1  ORF type:complete len:132 (+),score=12.77 Tamp_23561:258-653(+)
MPIEAETQLVEGMKLLMDAEFRVYQIINENPGDIWVIPSKQKASGMVYQRDWWRVAGFIMEKPEKHGLIHNGKARKTRSCSSWGILETTRGCSHSEPPACWRAFQKHCFSSPDFAFCHALFLTVFPAEFQV